MSGEGEGEGEKSGKDFQKKELLTPENLVVLEKELEQYKTETLKNTGKEASKSGFKNKEKEIRGRLYKEQKNAQKQVSTPSSSSSSSSSPSSTLSSLSKPEKEYKFIYTTDVASSLKDSPFVQLKGWVHSRRSQGKLTFIHLRDGSGFIQVVFSGALAATKEIIELTRETSLVVYGKLVESPKDATIELSAEFAEIVGACPAEFENELNADSDLNHRLNMRHLDLRSTQHIIIMRIRSRLLLEIRKYMYGHHFEEVTPPTIVKNACEGGSNMFCLDYYGEKSFMTESSQLYLEAGIPVLGNVFCILPSYRAEKSATRRHLAEFTHFEAEMPFYTFEQMLQLVEDILVVVTNGIYDQFQKELKDLKSKFQPLKRGFMRMRYSDAIKWLEAHPKKKEKVEQKIRTKGKKSLIRFKDSGDAGNAAAANTAAPSSSSAGEEGKEKEEELVEGEGEGGDSEEAVGSADAAAATGEVEYYPVPKYGEDIQELLERHLVDTINQPILLNRFPTPLKAFYMQPCADNSGETESVDVLVPTVGEIMGGSMRIWNYEQLMANYKAFGMSDDKALYWYNDLRKYGTTPHGGFGFGVERLLCWICGDEYAYNIREVCLFPRYFGRVLP